MEDVDYSKLFDEYTREIIEIGKKLIAKTPEGLLRDLTEDQAVKDEVEDIEPKVSCKKNATEELVRILKLNRARKDDN
jgi:hypothetical protein